MTADEPIPERALALFTELFELPPAARKARLAGEPDHVRTAVEQLLEHHDRPATLLSQLLESDAAEIAPDRIPGYTIEGELGRGGMGIVFAARQHQPNRAVALKMLPSSRRRLDERQRFAREVEILGLLQHPGICRIYDAGSIELDAGERSLWFAMERIDGQPLTEFAADEGLSAAGRCELLARVCDAVHYAHERGVVHRDLKPANVLVQGDGSIKTLDFGIARVLRDEVDDPTDATRTGFLLGTLAYMSPEQFRGDVRAHDGRTDVYALGALLYELLTGQLPLQVDTRTARGLAHTIESVEPARLRVHDRALRGDLEIIVATALAKTAADRYATAAELADDLRRYAADQPITARHPSTLYQLRKFARRNRTFVAGVLATFAALAIGMVVALVLLDQNRALTNDEQAARKLAERSAEALRQSLYAAQMRLAGNALQAKAGGERVRSLVANWQPHETETTASPPDLRGFEWRYLWACSHRQLLSADCASDFKGMHWLTDDAQLYSSGRCWSAHDGSRTAILGEVVHQANADASMWLETHQGRELRVVWLDGRTTRIDEEPIVLRAAFSPDNGLVAIYLKKHRAVRVFETDTGKLVAEMPSRGPSGTYEVEFSPDGTMLAVDHPHLPQLQSKQGRPTIGIWSTADWARPPKLYFGGIGRISALHFDNHSARIGATGRHYDGGEFVIWDVNSGEEIVRRRHPEDLWDLAMHPSDARIAVCGDRAALYVHDLERDQSLRLTGHRNHVSHVRWNHSGTRLASIGSYGRLQIWDAEDLSARRSLPPAQVSNGHGARLSWNADGTRISARRRHTTWDLESNEVLKGETRFLHPGATARWPHRNLVIERSGQPTFSVRVSSAAHFEFHPTDPLYAFAGKGGTWVLDYGSGELRQLWQKPGGIAAMRFSPDGKWLVQLHGSAIRIADAKTGHVLHQLDVDSRVRSFCQSNDPDVLILGCADQTIRRWSISNGEQARYEGHTSEVHALALHPNGSRLASGGADRTVRIWDRDTQSELLALQMPSQVMAIAWSPDGQMLAATSRFGAVTVWDARAGYRIR